MRSLLTIVCLLATPGLSYAKGVQVELDYIDVTRAPDFYVYVDYINEANKPIRGLSETSVTVQIDGESFDDPFDVQPFSKTPEGVAFVLLVSNYRGFGPAFEAQKKGLIELVSGLRPQDMAAVYSYAEGVNPLVDFTSDKEELKAAIRGVPSPEKPVNVFLDAVIAALEAFPAQDPTFPRRRGIVMMADALDQNLSDKRGIVQRIKTDLAPKAKALGVKFYSLGYTIESEEGLRIMKTLKKKFGGTFRRVRDSELKRSGNYFRDILDRVHGQYVVHFVTDDLDHEERHTLQVNINHKGTPIESTPVEFQPPEVEGTSFWYYLLWFLGIIAIIGLVIMIISAIANREPREQADAQVQGRACPMCSTPMAPGELYCESCLAVDHVGRLTINGGEWHGFIYPIADDNVTIGSREGEIIVPDGSVSGKHASIRVDEMKFELADLNSTNGTFVNGKRISKQFLRVGDEIRCGNVELKFSLR